MENTGFTFQNNLSLLRKKNPDLADILLRIDARTLPFASGFPEEKNLIDTGISSEEYLFSSHKAKEEIQNFWKERDFSSYNVLFIYGTGLGFPYEILKTWLHEKPQRRVVFLEDDRRMLVRLLELPESALLLSDPQVQIESFLFEIEEYSLFESMLHRLTWYYLLSRHKFLAIPYYAEKKKKRFALLMEHFQSAFHEKTLNVQYRIHLSHLQNQNTYANFLDAQNVFLQSSLKGALYNVPAIICGAGPSLSKQLPLLKTVSSKAAIFAAGSSLFVLDKQNITPHFTGVIDPKPPYRPYFLQTQFEIPTFYQAKASSEILSFLHGSKILCYGRSASPIESWVEKKLSFPTTQTLSGYTIGDFMTMVALFLGCNPIILVGMDLAFTDEKYYSSEITGPTLEKEGLIQTKDIHGNPIFTKKDWNGAAKHLSTLARTNPNRIFLNATEGGIGFENIAETPFSDVCKKHLISDQDIPGMFHTYLSQATALPGDKETFLSLFAEIKMSLLSCLETAKKMEKELEVMVQDFAKKSDEELSHFTKTFLDLEKKLHAEFTYTLLITPHIEYMSKILEKTRDDIERQIDPKGSLWRAKKSEVDLCISAVAVQLDALQSQDING